MTNIFVFSQNLILDSLNLHADLINGEDINIFLTTHFLFENEREQIMGKFKNAIFFTFADYLTDEEMEKCDIDSYTSADISYEKYLTNLKYRKNEIVVGKIRNRYHLFNGYILSDDLGIDKRVWVKYGFKWLEGHYYYRERTYFFREIKNCLYEISMLRKIYRDLFGARYTYSKENVYVAFFNNRKYVFLGNMNRIGYRLGINFQQSEEECEKLNAGEYEGKETCTYMTTWHEHGKCKIPDDDRYEVRWAQDGYLPPNYSHKDYFFKPKNVVYYCWDELGTYLFKNQGLPYEKIPFKKKLFLPDPVFPKSVRNILVVASGSGDWTALKNRSDDDIMVFAFAQMARRFPDINFTYRCHPTWVHPQNVGVNAINRVSTYFDYLNLPNLTLSSNIPVSNENGFQLSYARSSFEEDVKKADFVFGEHSISMIDAALQGIPFCSVNLTCRRNFFVGISDMGFPACTSVDEIADIIMKVSNEDFQRKYLDAVIKYNDMVDID